MAVDNPTLNPVKLPGPVAIQIAFKSSIFKLQALIIEVSVGMKLLKSFALEERRYSAMTSPVISIRARQDCFVDVLIDRIMNTTE